MLPTKPFTRPVYWIGFLFLIKLVLAILVLYFLNSALKYQDPYIQAYYRYQFKIQIISQSVFLIILAAEIILYWRIRKRIIRKDFVWVHIGGLLLAFVIAPIFMAIFTAFQSMANGNGDVGNKISIANNINTCLIWAGLIIGHIGFVLVLINVYKKNSKGADGPTNDNLDILNDYV